MSQLVTLPPSPRVPGLLGGGTGCSLCQAEPLAPPRGVCGGVIPRTPGTLGVPSLSCSARPPARAASRLAHTLCPRVFPCGFLLRSPAQAAPAEQNA